MQSVRPSTIEAFYYADPIERYAESAWRRLELTPPVDLKLVCKFLKIRLRKQVFKDSTICGIFTVTPKGFRVVKYNCVFPVPRQRFTIAHEVGHALILPKNHPPGEICKLRTTGPERKGIEERRCDRFAAALLIPHWLLCEWWKDLRFNPSGRIPIIADRLQVSHSAVRIRARELELG